MTKYKIGILVAADIKIIPCKPLIRLEYHVCPSLKQIETTFTSASHTSRIGICVIILFFFFDIALNFCNLDMFQTLSRVLCTRLRMQLL